jgi:hypothetical protein
MTLFAYLAVIGPDCIGSGAHIHQRYGMFTWLCCFTWLSMQVWSRRALQAMTVLFIGVALFSAAMRFPAHSAQNRGLTDFVNTASVVRPGSTVLAIMLEKRYAGIAKIQPYMHAVGYLTPSRVIDMSNYEAATDYFPTRFRPEVSPYPSLGTPRELSAIPGTFCISCYEKETRGRVDYIIFVGGNASAGDGRSWPETEMYHSQLASYQLAGEGLISNIRIYQRLP